MANRRCGQKLLPISFDEFEPSPKQSDASYKRERLAAVWNFTCENRDQKRARRFNDMRKGHRTHAFAQRLQLARDRLRAGGDF